jgi:hypothetical protein
MTNFKVGDTVKIIGNTSLSVNKVGDIGVVHGCVKGDQYRVSVEGRTQGGNWTCPRDMELVTTPDVPIGYVGLPKDMNLKDGDVVKGRHPVGYTYGYTYTVAFGEVGDNPIHRCISNYTLVSRAIQGPHRHPDYTTHDVATHNGMPVAARKKAPVVKTIGVRIYAGTGSSPPQAAKVKSTNGVVDWSTLTVD